MREADREGEELLRDFELIDAELDRTVQLHATRLKGAAASDDEISAIAGLNLRETPKSRAYALDISPSASAQPTNPTTRSWSMMSVRSNLASKPATLILMRKLLRSCSSSPEMGAKLRGRRAGMRAALPLRAATSVVSVEWYCEHDGM